MPVRKWKVAEARARLSEVLGQAQREPQVIENRGREIAVIVAIDDYRRLTEVADRTAPAGRLAAFLHLSAEVRAAGGAEIRLPRRKPRPSPFGSGSAR